MLLHIIHKITRTRHGIDGKEKKNASQQNEPCNVIAAFIVLVLVVKTTRKERLLLGTTQFRILVTYQHWYKDFRVWFAHFVKARGLILVDSEKSEHYSIT
jgi:hypothetical protein